tara:strand:- start:395 stop:649 length:255 start_codon:yes stop_codon:yes gene_type:complete
MDKNVINEFNQITRWPKKPSEKERVIKLISNKFMSSKKYSEKEVNQILKNSHLFNDIPLLRRELISRKYLSRKDDGSEYWKNKM